MKKFLQQILASFIGSVSGILFLLFLGGGGLIILLIALILSEDKPIVENQSALVFNLASQIKERESDVTLESLLSPDETETLTLYQVTKAIKKASQDDRISAIFLDGSQGNIETGYASLTEIRTALEDFKKTGKKIIAYGVNYGEKDYFLSSIADTIIMNPMGLVEINGFSSPQLFFASALQKYGIGFQIVRAGKYKAAVEPFIRDNYSQESKEQTQVLLNSLWQNYVTLVSQSRKISTDKIKNLGNNTPLLYPEEAQKLGIINQIAYFDEVKTKLKEITQSEKEDSFKQISINKYLTAIEDNDLEDNKIAILYAEGTIVSGQGNIEEIGSEYYAQQIQKIREDEDIKAVILRINSPGGSAVASELILRELQLTAKEKPVIVSMGDVAASGGYWIATVGEKIFAEKSTITGSIGVFGLLLNLEKISTNNGINYDVVTTNKFADMGGIFREKTTAEIKVYEQSVDKIYSLFLDKVAKSRKLTKNQVANIAQGRVWTGEDAKKVGLVDEIGGLNATINYTVNKLQLGNKYQIEEYPEQRTWGSEFTEKLSETQLQQKMNNPEMMALTLSQLKSELKIKEILQNPTKIYAILPFKLEIE
jgi:protease-4